ncbi:MAG: hypothetical protein NTY75_00990 [Candidatus Shapirobacteria bacterium]|nr:hypothetical protein [Candidatus Shapirobacteria bacterium]
MKQLLLILVSSLILTACGLVSKGGVGGKVADFSSDSETPAAGQITPYAESIPQTTVTYSQTWKINQEFKVQYKTFNPDGIGNATIKAISFKEISAIEELKPDQGKKLYLLELAVSGNAKNKGEPSAFNQIGTHPSPQFVLVDKAKNFAYVEETSFSDAYTLSKKLFELSKLTLDGGQSVTTAVVYQIDANIKPSLAFRFVNTDNKVEFYDISY